MQTIKCEPSSIPRAERRRSSNWYLKGESIGTKKNPMRNLKYGENKVGKSSSMDIRLPSRKTSAFHCTLTVNENEVILRDTSTNGTYVNHCKYINSRQILSDNDLIAFGQSTFKYDKDDHSVLVFRLVHQNFVEETIALSDDDGEPFVIRPVKAEIKTEAEELRSIDSMNEYDTGFDSAGENGSFEAQDEAHDWHRAEMFMDRLDFDQTNDGMDDVVELVSTARSTVAVPSTSSFIPHIELPDVIPITTKIKEEVGWNSYEYEKTLRQKNEKEMAEPAAHDTINLCSDDDDDDYTPTAPKELSEASISHRRNKKHKSTEYEYEMKLPEIETKRICIAKQPQEKKKVDNGLPESEKNRLIDSVQLNRECLRVKAHVVTHSRANLLVLDMLGAGIDSSATATMGKRKPSMPVRNAKIEPVTLPLEEDAAYPCKWSAYTYANRLISEITGWDVQWLLDQKSDAPICDANFEPFFIPENFDSPQEYQYTWRNLAKLELWDSILMYHRRENANRAVFPYLTDVKYVKRGDDLARFIFFCEAEVNEKDFRSLLYADHLVLVVHGQGKFLAIITTVKCAKGVDNKLKMTFQMEASKMRASELLSKPETGKAKLISVKSISNIRIELEQLNALMDIEDSSPLCTKILRPALHPTPLMGRVRCVDKFSTDEIVEALQKKCIDAVVAKQEAIYLIEGGAGTGKSLVLMNALIKMISSPGAFQSKRILFCGATNISVDHIAHRFYKKMYTKRFVRFGNLETIHQSLSEVTIRAHNLSITERQRLNEARLVLTTTNLAANLLKVSSEGFDLCIIDEASTVSELMVLPLLKFKFKVLVMAGDKNFQFASTCSPISLETGFNRSLFKRIIDSYVPTNVLNYPTLCRQYRMDPDICRWANQQFYSNRMVETTVSTELGTHFPLQPYTVFSFHQDVKEVTVVGDILSICIAHADPVKYSYGIIAAFAQSKNLLDNEVRAKGLPRFEISGFDCFQGTEKDILLITAIKPEMFQFLGTPQSINLAMTRARRSLIFCGNFDKVQHMPIWKSFLDDAMNRGRFFDINPKDTDYVGKLLKR